MSRLAMEMHLKSVTVKSLLQYKSETFAIYASVHNIAVGFIGDGKYAVKTNAHIYKFDSPSDAINLYKELVYKSI